MRKTDNPRLIERNQAHTVAGAQPTNPVPILKANVVSIPNETDSKEALVRELAFHLYEERGCREGHDVEDWLEAEAIVRNGKQTA